ncbi:laccase 2 precursor [Mycena filopes]|nr:laccase 2 precursor [Mycena filopes]
MLLLLSTALAFSSLLLGADASIGPTADLQIVNKRLSPDGYSRSTVLAGGTFPGPLIKANKGDRFLLNVEDKLTDKTMLTDTSIHWHGIFQKATNWEDGVSWVTQCPITPQKSFQYNFGVPDQAGTFWYHSHLSTQYCDGLRGPLVIYDPNDPQRHLYESTIITLADWYHYPALQQPAGQPATAGCVYSPTPLIFRPMLRRIPHSRFPPLAVINVAHGKRYRFRLVSMSCDPDFTFSIDGHSMTIIEVDGVNHKPLTVDSIRIFAGQRYSFVLEANQPKANYWVRAQPNAGNTGFVNATNSAILRYAGADKCDPTTSSKLKQPLVETALHPLVPSTVPGKHVPGGADMNFVFNITLDFATGKFLMNGTTFTAPSVPVLLQILSQELMPKGNGVYALKPNKVVEVSIIGGSIGAPHPFHLHGHNFYVVRSAGNSTYNWDNPVIRDVVTTGESVDDLTTFRFVTDNAGPWFLHCHIDWHLDAGLAIVFAEDIPTIGKENPPVSWDQLCPTYNHVHPNATA